MTARTGLWLWRREETANSGSIQIVEQIKLVIGLDAVVKGKSKGEKRSQRLPSVLGPEQFGRCWLSFTNGRGDGADFGVNQNLVIDGVFVMSFA